MGFFDDVKATVTSAGREVGDKAKEIAESSKIKNAIAQFECSLCCIGKEVYETVW